MKLSLIIPAHNEARHIKQTTVGYLDFLRSKFLNDFEIIIVINGCTDNTLLLTQDLQQANPEIKVINDLVAAKGRAVRLGFKQAQGEWISFVDADNAISPLEWWKVFQAAVGGAELAMASRFLPSSQVFNRSWFRNIAGQIFSYSVRLIFNLPYRDTQCGAKVFNSQWLKKILPILKVDNMAFDVELLWLLARQGAKIKEVPIVWRAANFSAVANPLAFVKQSLKMLYSLLIIRLSSYSYDNQTNY